MDDLRSAVDAVFAPEGILAAQPGCDYRPGQHAMALLVAESFDARRHRIIEAPTGIGKSLAYVVPGVLLALARGGRTIVSTHTRNLQDQLLARDIPLARNLLALDFAAAVLKGRRNYLCTTRLDHAVAAASTLFPDDAAGEIERLRAWARTTRDGDIEHAPFSPSPAVWDAVCSERDLCGPPHCGARCFHQRARDRARAAQLLVVNHALLFTLLARDTAAALPDRTAALVLDEAHMLESTATGVLGRTLSHGAVAAALHRLYQPRTRRGLLTRTRGVRTACAAAEADLRAFFAAAARIIPAGAQTAPLSAPERLPAAVTATLGALSAMAADAARAAEDEARARELERAAAAVAEARALIAEFLEQGDTGHAVWLEADTGSPSSALLRSAPVETGAVIGPLLFRPDTPAVLTSATLAAGGTFEPFAARVGAHGVICDQLASPFDLGRAMTVVLARGIPEPEDPAYRDALPHWIRLCVRRSHGRALVLFTNASVMQRAAVALRAALEEDGIRLLVQGEGTSRAALLDEFRADVGSVLFGLDSFWMGVDVPGPSLEHVVVTRLPFPVPDHPLTAARCERITARGGNAFMEWTLPEAILRLRQGAGRLIRSEADRGLVTILDARMLTRRYGAMILAALPRCPVELMDERGDTEVLPRDDW